MAVSDLLPSLSDVAVSEMWPRRVPDSRFAYTTAVVNWPTRAVASSFGSRTDQPGLADADSRYTSERR